LNERVGKRELTIRNRSGGGERKKRITIPREEGEDNAEERKNVGTHVVSLLSGVVIGIKAN